MASNIVFTPKEGVGSSLTLYGSEDAAGAAGVVYITWNPARKSPWKEVTPPAYDGLDAMFMGANPIRYIIEGYVFDNAKSEATLTTHRNNVLALNAVKDRYTLAGPFTHATSDGMIVEDVRFLPIGEGTGPEHRFQIFLTDLGV